MKKSFSFHGIILLLIMLFMLCASGIVAFATDASSGLTNANYYTLPSGKLQLEWDANMDAECYHIYQNGTFLCKTDVSVAIVDGGADYTVSAICNGTEGAQTSFRRGGSTFVNKDTLLQGYMNVVEELGKSTFYDTSISVTQDLQSIRETLNLRTATADDVDAASAILDNVRKIVYLSKRNLTPNATSYVITPDAFNSDYIKEYMFDGNTGTRYAAMRVGSTSIIDAVFDLGGIYSVDEIEIYEFANGGIPRSETTEIELFVNGAWVKALVKTDTKTLGSGNSSKYHIVVDTDEKLEVSKVHVRLEQLTDGYNNLSIWELYIWGNRFSVEGGFSAPVLNENKPTSSNIAIEENFATGSYVYTDRSGSNFMKAAHVGSALKGLTQIRLPIADSSRTSNNEALTAFLKGDNTYFTFQAQSDGTVYVAFTHPLVNFTEARGWKKVASGTELSRPNNESLMTLDQNYSDTSLPYYFTRLQGNASGISSAVAFTYCYALDYQRGDIVSIPTPAISSGLTSENLVVLVDSDPLSPYLSAISLNGEHYSVDENDTCVIRVPDNTTTLTLDAITLSKDWECVTSPSSTIDFTSDYASFDMTVTDGKVSRTYNVAVLRENDSILKGNIGAFEGAHYNGYFRNNDIDGNVTKMTDGNSGTYLEVWNSVPKAGNLIFKYDLDGYRSLDTFSVVASAPNGTSLLGNVTIEGRYLGKWFVITTLDLPAVSTIDATIASATVTIPTPVIADAIRFNCGYNSAVLTADGSSIGSALRIYEIGATEKTPEVPSPGLVSVTVNGKQAELRNGRYYITADNSVKNLTIEAIATNVSSVIKYEPSNSLSFNGKKKMVTITVTNILSQSEEYTLIIDGKDAAKNVLLGVTPTFTLGSGTYSAYPLSYVNDGDRNTRLACGQKTPYEIEFILDGTYDLSSMDFYAYVHGGNPLTGIVIVRGLIGDTWVDIASYDSSVDYEPYNGNANNGHTTLLTEAKGVRAVRVYIEQNPAMPNNAPSIWEIEIQGTPSKSTPANILLGKEPIFVTSAGLYNDFPLSYMTDGNLSTRMAAYSTSLFEVEIPLGSAYDIHTFVLYSYVHGGMTNTGTATIRGLIGGKWYDLAVVDMREGFIANGSNSGYKVVYLEARDVEALRILVSNNEALGKGASIWEVCAFGAESEKVDEEKDLFSNFQIQTNVTTHNSFDVNIYIPCSDKIQSITIAGTDYAITSLTPVEISAKPYYKFTLPVDAKGGCQSYPLSVTLTDGELTQTKTYQISLTRYLALLMASNATENEKQIAVDILAYIRAAIIYFNAGISEGGAAYAQYQSALTTLDTLLARYNYIETVPECLTQSTTPTETGKGIAGATLSLDSTVSFVLQAQEGYTIDDFTFLVGGKPALVEEKDGYIFITVFAYRIKDTLSWTVRDKDNADIVHKGVFSLANYYTSATVQENAELKSLVECLAAFSESANKYIEALPVTLTVNYRSENGTLLGSDSITREGGSTYCIYAPSFNGYYTRDLKITGTMTKNQTITLTYKEIPNTVDTEHIAALLPGIVCWGDSITAGAGSSNTTIATSSGIDLTALGSSVNGGNYPTVLSNLIRSRVAPGIPVSNCGVGGETSAVISARAMTETYFLYVGEEVSVAPAGSVVINIEQYSSTGRLGILRQGNGDVVNAVSIVGKDADGNEVTVTGNITVALREGVTESIYTCPYTDLVYTFTRTDNGTSVVTLPKEAKIVTRCSYAYDGDLCIIFMGENGGYSSVEELIKQQREILEACDSTEKFIIIGLSSGTETERAEMENAMREYWGNHYFSAREELSSADALRFAGFSDEEIESVASDIKVGRVSTLLLHDRVHLNAVGYALLANAVFDKMAELGYFDAIFNYYESLR